MSEEWRDIPGYEGLYQVSNLGLVRNSKGLALKLSLTGTKYFRVNLTKNGKGKKHYVHRLVLLTFKPPNREGVVCNHLDGSKLNNKLANLEWITPRENNLHAVATGLSKAKSRHYLAKDIKIYELAHELIKRGIPVSKIKIIVPLHESILYDIKRGKHWSCK